MPPRKIEDRRLPLGAIVMMTLNRILCPIDFSEPSRHAWQHALTLARWYGATLTALHVFQTVAVMDQPPVVMTGADRDRLLERLREFTSRAPDGVHVDVRVQAAADVHREILHQADRIDADLIVIGSHGRSGFGRLLLGSVTEQVLAAATCTTLVVPSLAQDAHPGRPPALRRILCPVDFSETSLRALTYATTLAEEADAALILLHAVESTTGVLETPDAAVFETYVVRDAARSAARARLEALVPAEVRTYCRVEIEVTEGPASSEILGAAMERGADLIVMGTQGRSPLGRLLFGSNAARVIRRARCPVMVVCRPRPRKLREAAAAMESRTGAPPVTA
jgi:nucleotide-binding universal stress UspA family protein